jgi:hypothetical protein
MAIANVLARAIAFFFQSGWFETSVFLRWRFGEIFRNFANKERLQII